MQAGSVVECRDKRKVFCTVCLDSKSNQLRLLMVNGKEFSQAASKVLQQTGHILDLGLPRVQVLDALKAIETAIEAQRRTIDLPELWEVVHDERRSFPHSELAELLWGQAASSDQRSALLRELVADSLYFELQDNRFLPRLPAQVHELQQQRQLAEQRQQERHQAFALLQHAWQVVRGLEGAAVTCLSPQSAFPGVPSGEIILSPAADLGPWLPLLQGLALHGEHFDRYSDAVELLREVGAAPSGPVEAGYIAWQVVVQLGIWQPDENLSLLRLQVPQRFSRAAQEEVARLVPELKFTVGGREDLRSIDAFTIDDPDTMDIDDALSARPLDEGFEIGIHIADPAHFLELDSALDREANTRATSIYLPDRKVEMLPEVLSQDLCSLIAGHDRYAISVLATVSREGHVVSYRLVESVVRVARRLSYEEVNRLIETVAAPYKALFDLVKQLQRRRVESGAQIQDRPQLKIRVRGDGDITVEKISPDQPSQLLVSELMILANQLVAQFLNDRQIPAIYRVQSPPDTPLESEVPVRLKGAAFTTRPAAHFSLGLAAYMQITSPIRRYIDLILHRQLKAALRNAPPPYGETQLNFILAASEQARNAAAQVERETNRYWLLKYLQERIQGTYLATVLDVREGRAFVQLDDYLLETAVYPRNRVVRPGDSVRVRISSIDPYRRFISLVLADEETQGIQVAPESVVSGP